MVVRQIGDGTASVCHGDDCVHRWVISVTVCIMVCILFGVVAKLFYGSALQRGMHWCRTHLACNGRSIDAKFTFATEDVLWVFSLSI